MVKTGVELSEEELERYQRQIILPEVGIKGQFGRIYFQI